MKTSAVVLLALVAGCYASVAAVSTPFYDDLSPYGQWVQDPTYGAVFIPSEQGYVPYSEGYWAYSDYGPTWVSSAPFGWATEHYGRWISSPTYGWAWIPGTEWSPAWVEFRYDNAYLAWSPLGPYGYRYPYQSWHYAPYGRFFDQDVRRYDRGVTVHDHDRYRTMRPTHSVDRNFFVRRNVVVTPQRDVPIRRYDVAHEHPYDHQPRQYDHQPRQHYDQRQMQYPQQQRQRYEQQPYQQRPQQPYQQRPQQPYQQRPQQHDQGGPQRHRGFQPMPPRVPSGPVRVHVH